MNSAAAIGILDAFLSVGAGCMAVPSSLFAAECLLAGLKRSAVTMPPARPAGVKVGILIPAHNEAGGIEATLRSIQAQLQDGDRLLVVADNCTDHTADVVRACGAEVTERYDTERRGKGYALAHGVKTIAGMPGVSVVVMVDADCLLGHGALNHLVAQCHSSRRPVQARYLMKSPDAKPSLNMKIAEFAWTVKNHVRPVGMHALNLPCHLTGSGMAFQLSDIQDIPLASGNLVVDMQLGLDLAMAGCPPEFCEAAVVTSQFPMQADAQRTQRERWEHGHLSTILHQAPRLVAAAFKGRHWALLGLAVDLCIPPLTSLVMLVMVTLGLTGLYWALTGHGTSLVLALGAWLAIVAGVSCAWATHGRSILSATELVGTFHYMFRKVPLYFRFLKRRQVSWIRTQRNNGRE